MPCDSNLCRVHVWVGHCESSPTSDTFGKFLRTDGAVSNASHDGVIVHPNLSTGAWQAEERHMPGKPALAFSGGATVVGTFRGHKQGKPGLAASGVVTVVSTFGGYMLVKPMLAASRGIAVVGTFRR